MRTFLRPFSWVVSGLLLSAQVLATNAGWRSISVPGLAADAPPIPVVLYYPTQSPARAIPMGPFTVQAAMGAPADAGFKGLIVLSHGTGGSELGHSSLAEALAQQGYLVAALRHPGDNWQDQALLRAPGAQYFIERPQHLSRVIDALLLDPIWGQRIAKDSRGPRVGALGHSAGGYSVLALAGGEPDVTRVLAHCAGSAAADPIFCSMGRAMPGATQASATPPTPPLQIPALADTRVRAVVAMAPVGVIFSGPSLARVRIPTMIYEAEQDRFLVPRFHAEWIARHLTGTQRHSIPKAWHFAFMDTPSMPILSPDGDIGANPPGFDRQALLRQMGRELPAFFDQAWVQP